MASTETGRQADALIAAEIAKQDRMWGPENERADTTGGQLLRAAMAQGEAVIVRQEAGVWPSKVPDIFPHGWSGFRSYGGDVPNLVVMAAFIRQEIARKLAAGEDPTRLERDRATQPFTADQPRE